ERDRIEVRRAEGRGEVHLAASPGDSEGGGGSPTKELQRRSRSVPGSAGRGSKKSRGAVWLGEDRNSGAPNRRRRAEAGAAIEPPRRALRARQGDGLDRGHRPSARSQGAATGVRLQDCSSDRRRPRGTATARGTLLRSSGSSGSNPRGEGFHPGSG